MTPLAYQWLFGANEIIGATNSALILSEVQITNAGTYSVIVTNVLGMVTSSNAVLTINPFVPGPTYDLSRDFSIISNPNGAWSYGAKSNASPVSFSLLTFPLTQPAQIGAVIQSWQRSRVQQPVVSCNTGTASASYANGEEVFPPGTVWVSASEDGTPLNYGVVRFTLPSGAAGTYQLQTAVRSIFDGATSGDGDFHVDVNGSEIFGSFLPPHSSSGYTKRGCYERG